MAHNSKKNKRHAPKQDEDDYVYPTAKVRETKTRGRRHDANLIKDGLLAYENPDEDADENEDQEIMDDCNDMITEFNETQDVIFNQDDADEYDHIDHDTLHDAIMDDYDYEWEDY